ncbi:ATP-binding protein [Streptomyces sp. NPDC006332]|uniref:ATP-binding protein n=1 Tax=Streptomyces sp. NPDC006332 TaxID=3155456 RepID=UPI0033BC64F2
MASVIPPAPLGTDAAAGRPLGLGADGVPPARTRWGASEAGGPEWFAASEGAGPERSAAERRFRFELAAHPGSPAQARRLTMARLTGWSVCADTCDSAALVVTELVTNAIVHTASRRVICELHDGEDLVRIAVRDEGCAPGEPHPSAQRPDEEHGRGLLLVDALCHAWGAQEHGPGLLVWAELARQDDMSRGDSGPRNDLGWGARPKPGPSGSPGSAATAGAGLGVDPRVDVEPRHGTAPEIETGGTAGVRQHKTGVEWA